MELKVGDIVEGKITGIKDYGVFVDIGDGQSGMVHISEVSRTYVNNISDYVKLGDTFKMKVITVGDDGKIALSIKRAEEGNDHGEGDGRRRERKPYQPPPKPDGSYTWTPKKAEPASFEEMMSRFKQTSDEKFSDLKRKNPESGRSRRGNGSNSK